nr:laccase-21 [Quercus suber]
MAISSPIQGRINNFEGLRKSTKKNFTDLLSLWKKTKNQDEGEEKKSLKALLDEDLEFGDDLPHSIAYTINGEPGDLCPCSKETTNRWMVDQGKTYLLRQVNAVVSADMFFAIAQHDLTIVGTDGNFIKPAVQLYNNGQDSDLLSHNVTANQSLGLYYIAASQFWSQVEQVTEFDLVNATMILQYRECI